MRGKKYINKKKMMNKSKTNKNVIIKLVLPNF